MTWVRERVQKSMACNAELARHYRKERGWTQKQLSEASGYCVRVISKIESGARVLPDVIETVAKALSTDERQIYPEDLIAAPLELSRRYIDALHTKQRDAAVDISDFTDADASFHIAGDPNMLPFAGKHRGLASHHDVLQHFFAMFEVPDHNYRDCYKYYTAGSEVVAWGTPWIHPTGRPMKVQMPVTIRFRFRKGKLACMEWRFEASEHLNTR